VGGISCSHFSTLFDEGLGIVPKNNHQNCGLSDLERDCSGPGVRRLIAKQITRSTGRFEFKLEMENSTTIEDFFQWKRSFRTMSLCGGGRLPTRENE
jgi:hypothetical protein